MELLRLSRLNKENSRQAIVSPPPLHADLGGQISTRREAVTKELSAMEKAGLVQKNRGSLVLLDVPRLVEMIGEDKPRSISNSDSALKVRGVRSYPHPKVERFPPRSQEQECISRLYKLHKYLMLSGALWER